MSVRIMTAVWTTHLPDSEKLVLLALADCANDEGLCWPSMATLATKCSKTDRTVQAAVKSLVTAGHLSRQELPGRGCRYIVHPISEAASPPKPLRPRSSFAPEAASPPKPATATPEAASDKPSGTINPQRTAPAPAKPAKAAAVDTFLPADFKPEPKAGSLTAKAMDAWPPGELEEQLEHFTDHHTAKRTKSADWQASWRTWVKNWKSFNGNRPHHGQPRIRAGNPRSHEMDDVFRDLGVG